jgi:hypothetical protein
MFCPLQPLLASQVKDRLTRIGIYHALYLYIDHLPPKLLVDSVYVSGLLEEVSVLEQPLGVGTKAFRFGVGIVAGSLSSMVTTVDMVGRSFGSSCTHKSPIFTHFTN